MLKKWWMKKTWFWVCLCDIPQSFPADWQVERWHWTAAVTHLRTPLSLDTPWRVKTHAHTWSTCFECVMCQKASGDVWHDKHSWCLNRPGSRVRQKDLRLNFICVYRQKQPPRNVCYSGILIYKKNRVYFRYIFFLIKQIFWKILYRSTTSAFNSHSQTDQDLSPRKPNSWNICSFKSSIELPPTSAVCRQCHEALCI